MEADNFAPNKGERRNGRDAPPRGRLFADRLLSLGFRLAFPVWRFVGFGSGGPSTEGADDRGQVMAVLPTTQDGTVYSPVTGMFTRDQVVRSIMDVAGEMNETLSRSIDVAQGEGAPLFGSDGVLDSLGLVSFIVAVEQALDESLGVGVTLADERAVSQRVSPFRTIGTLVDYVMTQSARSA